MMFKTCYFNYAGEYSGKYNLIMAYVNRNESFVSGGVYKPILNHLPDSAEALLYGLKYSENPIEFEVDIVNPERDIPMSQMREIKRWLFGQDGWKKLKLKSPDYEKFYLNCLLIPENDISDYTGYRGIRCKVQNISGFWYGDEEIFELTQADLRGNIGSNGNYSFTLNVKSDVNTEIYPIIQCKMVTHNLTETIPFWIKNYSNNSVLSMNVEGDDLSKMTSYLCTIDTKYPYFSVGNSANSIINFKPRISEFSNGIFYLNRGENNIQLACHVQGLNSNYRYYNPFIIKYTPKYRIGGV